MKTLVSLISFCLLPITLCGQLVYHDASAFPLLGKATDQTATRYERLPDSLETISRKPVWELGQNTAGLAVRFRSNSTTIAAKWTVTLNRSMNHMTATGIRGLDLYALEDDSWRFVNSGRPGSAKENTATIIANMKPVEREYMLYLPLYDGVSSLSIGIDSLATMSQPAVNLPVREKPVVCYGTSILQGGCASRPGMAHTNLLSRWLNREFINLGFSGNALLDYEIAEVVASVDASLIVLDFVPNATAQQIDEKVEKFYSIIRNRRPDTPILFIEDPIFPHTYYDQRIAGEVKKKNEALSRFFKSLKKKGEKNIWYLSSEGMIGYDAEATVDGVHFTDLGFLRYAKFLYPVIKKRMKK